MGIFGRDERTTQKPAASAAPTRPQPTPAGAATATTVISRGNRIEGTISGSGDVRVEGELEGAVDGTGSLRIEAEGTVTGTLAARTVVVAGTVRGDVTAGDAIQLEASAVVEGNITAPRIQIAEGASFDGKISMKQRPVTSSAKKS